MKRAIVVGSGAGGAAVARALQGAYRVTVIEAGRKFRPFLLDRKLPEFLKRIGLLFDPREISLLFPAMRVQRTGEGMLLVRGIGTGGTTTIATGNAVRADGGLRALGIDLDEDFAALARQIPVSTEHRQRWRPPTARLFAAARSMGLAPFPTPKMGNFAACRNCGRCVLGCPHGVKWDARVFLNEAAARGAEVVTGSVVERLVVRQGQAQGVVVRSGFRRRVYDADWIVLAAGGLGTPVILDNSGIAGEPRLFVDPVLCVAAPFPDAGQDAELPMPFIVERDGYIISPYFDQLSYFFNRRWKPPAGNILSLMIKLADANSGTVDRRGIRKVLTAGDRRRLSQAVDLCAEIFLRLGVRRDSLLLGTLNAGHPGGMFPLTPACSRSLRPTALPENVYIADASLFPAPLGKPPILTIMALANAIAKRILSSG